MRHWKLPDTNIITLLHTTNMFAKAASCLAEQDLLMHIQAHRGGTGPSDGQGHHQHMAARGCDLLDCGVESTSPSLDMSALLHNIMRALF